MINERAERIATIEDFGEELITSGDLDPLYVALAGADMSRDQGRRFLLAYWCCYNAGASAYISEYHGEPYWHQMRTMAANVNPTPIGGRWPRGHERRHFRGQKAMDAVDHYAKRFPQPERLLSWLEDETIRGRSFTSLRRRVMELPQFGPWIAFKVADMLERVMGVTINFDDADVLMFEQPYNSALEVWKSSLGSDIAKSQTSEKKAVALTAAMLVGHFRKFQAPPRNDRPVNIQEVETILCKWKSHNNGSYPMGIDSRELRHGLQAWAGVSVTAESLFNATSALRWQ